jgi:hypothetical protein
MKEHKNHTKTFGELSFQEQAKSITATINNLQAAINHHINNSSINIRNQTRAKCLKQINRLMGRLI